eukprot:357392-Chlamydomonas_euryale.AAC.46
MQWASSSTMRRHCTLCSSDSCVSVRAARSAAAAAATMAVASRSAWPAQPPVGGPPSRSPPRKNHFLNAILLGTEDSNCMRLSQHTKNLATTAIQPALLEAAGWCIIVLVGAAALCFGLVLALASHLLALASLGAGSLAGLGGRTALTPVSPAIRLAVAGHIAALVRCAGL